MHHSLVNSRLSLKADSLEFTRYRQGTKVEMCQIYYILAMIRLKKSFPVVVVFFWGGGYQL